MLLINCVSSENAWYEFPNCISFPFDTAMGVRVVTDAWYPQTRLGYPPVTGRRNNVGDRDCTHINVKGSLLMSKDRTFLRDYSFQKPDDPTKPFTPAEGMRIPNVLKTDANVFVIMMGESYQVPIQSARVVDGIFTLDYKDIVLSVHSTYTYVNLTVKWVRTVSYQGVVYVTDNYESYFKLTLGPQSYRDGCYKQFGASQLVSKLSTGGELTSDISSIYWTRCEELPEGAATQLSFKFDSFCDAVMPSIVPVSAQMIGQTSLDCVNACHILSLNAIAYVRDLRHISDIAKAVKSISEIRGAKSAANAYLGNKYGTQLFVRDTVTVMSTLTNKQTRRIWRGHNIARSRSSSSAAVTCGPLKGRTWSQTCNVKLYYRSMDDPSRRLLQTLYDYDVFPSAQNLWDLVPYSFCVDWFVGVGDYLDACDAVNYLHTVDTVASLVTLDHTVYGIPGEVLDPLLLGSFDFGYFRRQTGNKLDPAPLSVQSPESFHNWWEGAALLIQRIK